MPGLKPPPAVPHEGLHIADGALRIVWLKQHTSPAAQLAPLEQEKDRPVDAHCPFGAHVTTRLAVT
jgi:hypothetical protein